MEPTDTSETILPTLAERRRRHLPANAAFDWLRAGWRDLMNEPQPSLLYGIGVFIVSLAIVWGLFALELDYVLFPALAGFMVVGPLIAIGLYEKSRAIGAGERFSFASMLFVKPKSGGQVLYTGAILCLLMLLWMRAAVITYALFFGYRPFPGLGHVADMLFTTPTGWAMLVVGGAIGGVFAAFAFAISTFSIPMLLDKNVDAFTAMGTSISMVFRNLPVMLMFGVVVLALFLFSVATGLLGLIVTFPLLGHATWHAYKAME